MWTPIISKTKEHGEMNAINLQSITGLSDSGCTRRMKAFNRGDLTELELLKPKRGHFYGNQFDIVPISPLFSGRVTWFDAKSV